MEVFGLLHTAVALVETKKTSVVSQREGTVTSVTLLVQKALGHDSSGSWMCALFHIEGTTPFRLVLRGRIGYDFASGSSCRYLKHLLSNVGHFGSDCNLVAALQMGCGSSAPAQIPPAGAMEQYAPVHDDANTDFTTLNIKQLQVHRHHVLGCRM